MKVKQLESLPVVMVGDGQSPNVYFVSMQPEGVMMVTRDAEAAHTYWRSLPRTVETCLEDRLTGVIASTEPDDSGRLRTSDDFGWPWPTRRTMKVRAR